MLALMIGSQLSRAHGNPLVFVQFGRLNIGHTHPPAGSPIVPSLGYDGQMYWLQAVDPLLLHRSTVAGVLGTSPGYHFQRPAYPALSWLLAGGQRSLVPWSMLAINVLGILGLTVGFSVYARRRGWNPAWALAIGFMPGFLTPVLRDLSDVLATACMFGGLLLWERGRSWSTGALLAVAALSREPMILAAIAIAVDITGRCWRARGRPAEVRTVLVRAWPAVVLPVIAFIGWRYYLGALHIPTAAGTLSTGTSPAVFPPFNDFLVAARAVLHQGSVTRAVWVLTYLGLTAAGIVCGLTLLRRGTAAVIVLGPLFGVVLSVIFLSDQWALTRYTAPMFLALLLAGLEYRSRAALAICASAAVMTLLMPMI